MSVKQPASKTDESCAFVKEPNRNAAEHPWKVWAGTQKNDDVTQEWKREVQKYREDVERRDAEEE